MTRIQRSALVGYTPRQMFELVNSIREYPRFLPWCRAASIIQESPIEVEASLEIAFGGFSKSFTTRNQLQAPEQIHITLVSGPFRHLEGNWMFQAVDAHACRVSLVLEFELAGHWLDRLFQPVFYRISHSLVDAFCKRAVEIYGVNQG